MAATMAYQQQVGGAWGNQGGAGVEAGGEFDPASGETVPLITGVDLTNAKYIGKRVRIVGRLTQLEGTHIVAMNNQVEFRVEGKAGVGYAQDVMFEGKLSKPTSTDAQTTAGVIRDSGCSFSMPPMHQSTEGLTAKAVGLMRTMPELFGEQ
eukprot:TRINITY_DN4924_c0_g1_i1.p3 TRINITY_DN4924_c0_g1~~TRINITY_DN4924_c0_g1_i1.p3  ORF type:complete len:151 (+),score=60.15 TRINITY_DN4924_c0_g1_i1:67-519(+)